MSMKYLGKTIDIHCGGIDHLPVHHTNEIAQSEAANGQPLANCWMHTNHVTVEGEKISKSLGNGITLEDIEAKGFSLAAFRLHVLESHYRSQSKFSWESLEAASNRLKSWQALADLRFQSIPGVVSDEYINLVDDLPAKILNSLQDDLDTPNALAIFSEALDELANSYTSDYREGLELFLENFVNQTLGINLLASSDISSEQKQLLAEREKARASQNWPESDELRHKLKEQGIGLNDTPHGAIWYRL